MLRSIINSALSRRTGGTGGTTGTGTGTGRRPATAGGMGTGATGGRRAQDEAIGRGVRGLLRRFRI